MESKILEMLADNEFLAKLSQKCGNATLKLIQEEFDSSKDPYESDWVPNKKGTKTLVDTGALESSFQLTINTDGFTIKNDVGYGGYHQTGTSKMPQRMILPDGEIPAKWQEAYEKALEETVKETEVE